MLTELENFFRLNQCLICEYFDIAEYYCSKIDSKTKPLDNCINFKCNIQAIERWRRSQKWD